jgi:hypothetical protein
MRLLKKSPNPHFDETVPSDRSPFDRLRTNGVEGRLTVNGLDDGSF